MLVVWSKSITSQLHSTKAGSAREKGLVRVEASPKMLDRKEAMV